MQHSVVHPIQQIFFQVRNANKLFYTDKSLQTKVRNNCSTDVVPPVVAQARSTLVRKEVTKQYIK